jgi:pyruvate formate lyase activating enzyme
MVIASKLSRREFLVRAASCGPLIGEAGMAPGLPGRLPLALEDVLQAGKEQDRLQEIIRSAPKARYWTSTRTAGDDCLQCHSKAEDLSRSPHTAAQPLVRCLLCAHRCMIAVDARGKCRARMNIRGELRSLVYGRPMAIQTDPIEKKPFYHFLPGSEAFSLATSGCPLGCRFCQNWQISQSSPEDYDARFAAPSEVAGAAASRRIPVIAFTYNEPTVFAEYMIDIARAGKRHGLRHVMISCGFMNAEPLTEMCEVLDAIKIDLKGFDEAFYRNVSGGELAPVLKSIKQVAKSGRHLEIVNLMVPTLNDSDKMLRGLVDWMVAEIGPDVPVHFTRFHPDYQLLNLPPTPVATLERARDMALGAGIHYAYVGNVPGHPGCNTYCPGCRKAVIERDGMFLTGMNLKNGSCGFCGRGIAGVWK